MWFSKGDGAVQGLRGCNGYHVFPVALFEIFFVIVEIQIQKPKGTACIYKYPA